MIRYIKAFLIFISLYFILHTILVYGWWWVSKTLTSFSKEILWFGFALVIALVYWKSTIKFIKQYKALTLVSLFILVIWSSITIIQWDMLTDSIKNIIIWVKYGVLYMYIFYTALLVWYIAKDKIDDRFVNWVYYFYLGVICVWFLIQISKLIFPDLRYSIWFRTIDIYRPDMAPPIYYLTNVDGFVRLSWLFSGPNNYWFWLVGVLSIFAWSRELGVWKSSKYDIFGKIIYIASSILNLGRSIWIGMITQIIIYLKKNNIISKYKKTFYGLSILAIWALGYMTYHKWDSTIKHFESTIHGISKFLNNPWWYWLGSSGPGIYYNGFILPENYYLQIMIDFGIIWLILIMAFWVYIFWYSKNIWFTSTTSHRLNYMYLAGFVGMCIVGLVLHVFEDSMVNYLIFVPRWLILGNLMRKSVQGDTR